MTIETIDGVLYYVWRAGDELPSYQPIGASGFYIGSSDIKASLLTPLSRWVSNYVKVIWPKLLNDRAQHQRMIEEALKTTLNHDDLSASIARHNQLADMHTQSGNNASALAHLAKAGAYVKRMMEYVQEQIDKEGCKS